MISSLNINLEPLCINERDILERDRLFWKGDKNGMFTVKENCKLIEGGNLHCPKF